MTVNSSTCMALLDLHDRVHQCQWELSVLWFNDSAVLLALLTYCKIVLLLILFLFVQVVNSLVFGVEIITMKYELIFSV